MILPCDQCGGTGERREEYAGGHVMTPGGGPLRCLYCHGEREIQKRVPLTQLRQMLSS
jgi:hypothetical protein